MANQNPPQEKDRLGARVGQASAVFLRSTPYPPAIPNNESVMVACWFKYDRLPVVDANNFLFYVADVAAGLDQFYAFPIVAGTLRVRTRTAAGLQSTADFTCAPGDHCLVALIDRVNTRLRVWLDAQLVVDDALIRDPQWGGGTVGTWAFSLGTALLNTNTIWRITQMSFAAGSVPTLEQWSTWLRSMCDPACVVHPLIMNMRGSRHSDWFMGEGVYGATVVTDRGSANTADLAWQGGATVQTVRTRARTPWRRPRRTWYSLKAGYAGSTAATDFGFAVQPVIMRSICGQASRVPTAVNIYAPGISGPGGTNYIRFDRSTAVYYYRARTGGASLLSAAEPIYDIGSDTWFVCDGTVWYVIANGQRVATPAALTAAMDLSGNCTAYLKYANGDCADVCRIAAWNPATVPATLEAEIRQCVCNPEADPPSLTNKRVDFPLHSGLMPIGTETTVANQGLGGGTLTLSAARSTSCETMLAGLAP